VPFGKAVTLDFNKQSIVPEYADLAESPAPIEGFIIPERALPSVPFIPAIRFPIDMNAQPGQPETGFNPGGGAAEIGDRDLHTSVHRAFILGFDHGFGLEIPGKSLLDDGLQLQ
jgi:hypothetical protein